MSAHEFRLRRNLLVVTAGLLLVAGSAGCGGDSDRSPASKSPPTSTTQPSDALHTIAEWDEQDGDEPTPLEPGPYGIPASPWSVTDFTVEFPEGWTSQYGHVYATNSDEPDELGFYAVVVDEIFTDSCATEDESTQAVGPDVDDLITALRTQAGGAAVSQPVRTTLGGYPATRIDLEIPKHVKVSECRMAPAGLQIWYSEPADKYFVLLHDATASVYVVDVDGQRQVFLTQVGNSASAADRAELQAVLDSVRIEGSSSSPEAPTPITPTPITPTPTPPKTQSPQTWVDTAMTPTKGNGWVVPNPLDAVRDGWFQIVADHLHPSPRHAEWGQGAFELPGEGSLYSAGGGIGVMEASSAEGLLANGCAYLHPTPNLDRDESCHTEQTRGPNGEPVHVTSFQSLCTTWDADSAAPGVYYKNCGDYNVTVVVERNDGRMGYIDVQGRDYVEAMPFALADLVAAAADPRLALPDAAYDVPSHQTVASVVADHFPTWRADGDQQVVPLPELGYASAPGKRAPFTVGVVVRPAGGAPTCGEDPWTRSCTERRVYGADDPTIVYVHTRDDDEWADCCPRNTRAVSRTFVYVGPRHTVVVSESRLIPDGGPTIGAKLDQALIDLALDPRFQS